MRAGLRAVRGTERIHDEHIAQLRHLARERFGVLLFTLVETHVLAQHRIPGGAIHALEPVLAQRHRLAQQIRQAGGDRSQRELLVVLALLRTAQVREDENLCVLIERVADRRYGGTNPRITGNDAAVHGHVQVFPDQDPLVAQVRIGHAQDLHVAFDHASVASIMRLEKPHSLSYQEHTLTSVPSMTLVSVASKMEECGSPLKSTDTSGRSLYARMPFRLPVAASFIA